MNYAIVYAKSAAKSFKNIHPQDRVRLKKAIENLASTPRPPGCIQLSGGSGELRIRVGNYRIIYDVEDDRLIILVLRIAHRREVYR